MTVASLGLTLLPGAPALADAQDAPQGGTRFEERAEPERGPARPAAPAWPDGGAGAATARQLAGLRDAPARLAGFLREMPKGGDLHTRLSGAVPTETLIALAARDGLCVDESMTAVQAPCTDGARPAQDAVDDGKFRRRVIRAWSMEGFRKPGAEARRAHFLGTFEKFAAVTDAHRGRMLAAVARTAVANHQSYVEPLLTPRAKDLTALGKVVEGEPDFERMHEKLLAGDGMDTYVSRAAEDTQGYLDEYYEELGCASDDPEPACGVEVRFVFQAERTSDPTDVFTQLLAGFLLAENSPYYVGVNLVQAEDDPVALRDYRLQMRMIRYLKSVHPTARVTLNAGELTKKSAPAEDRRFHIREAVETAGAERIGHGVGVLAEDHPEQLLRTMARRKTAVEVPLTGDCQTLGVCGPRHPLRRYLDAGVPVALSTGDQGVSRTDITREYGRAAVLHGASYEELRASARASLDHAFIQGLSLWRGPGDHRPVPECADAVPAQGKASPDCLAMIEESPKASLQWRFEQELADFEARQPAAD